MGFLGALSNTFGLSVLVLVYMFLFMLERERLRRFALKLSKPEQRDNMASGLERAGALVIQYLWGRLILIAILAIVYSIGFLAFGLKYAIPLAILSATLSIIPYLGNLIAGVIIIALSMATGGSITQIIGIAGVLLVTQLLESNILEPWILGLQVEVNPLFTLVSIIGLSVIWGVAGTILAIPLAGTLKEAFDRIPGMEPYGHLMGLEEEQ